MRPSILLLAVLGSLLGCDVLAGMRAKQDAGATPDTPVAPTVPPVTASPSPAPVGTDAASLEKSFAALDINQDGQLDGIEVQRCGCKSADRDGNGEISKAEYLAAGLLGRLPQQQPGARPAAPVAQNTPTTKPTANLGTAPASGPAPLGPAPAPAGGAGLPLGTYNCFSLVGRSLVARGGFVILDGSRYQMSDGTGAGTYAFDPNTKAIRWLTGVYSNTNEFRDARQVSPKQITMKTGKDGFFQYDCDR